MQKVLTFELWFYAFLPVRLPAPLARQAGCTQTGSFKFLV